MKTTQPIIAIEEQFKIMADSAPVLIWISGLDKLCYFFNAGWLRFTGRTIEQEMGNGWAVGVHPEDFDRCLATYITAFDERASFTMEYRLKRHDGLYRWLTDNGVPRYTADGSFAGFIGTCVDVHEIMEGQRLKTEMFDKKALLKEQEYNEELAATNEELASSNEELLTTNEELSVARENLSTMNLRLEEIVSIRTKELLKSEQRYRVLVNSAPVAIGTLTGLDFTITSANDTILRFWGKTRSILGMKLEDALPELMGQPFLEILTQVFVTSKPYYGNEVSAMLEHDGELKECYFNFIYTPLNDENGVAESIVVVASDVTEQVNTRKNIEQTRNRLRSMVMTAPVGMTILQSRDLIVEIANQPMLEVWHRRKEGVLGRNLWDIFPEIKATEFKRLLESVFDSGEPIKIPETLSPHPEKESYIDISYDPLFGENGLVESILVTVIDITEKVNGRKLVEQSQTNLQAIVEELHASNEELISTNDHLEHVRTALEQSIAEVSANETKFRFMLNAIPQQVWTADPSGALAYVNEVVCDDFGFNTEEIVGHGWQAFIHPDDLAICLEKWTAALISGEEYMVEFRLLFADGNYYWHLSRALPLIENGDVSLWLGTNTNIQIQKQNEEIKDEFLSIASHELKTPLTSIKAFNQLMMRSEKPAGMETFVKKSADQIFRLEKLIMDLLDVTKINAGKMSYNMEEFDFREMLVTSVESMQHTCLNHQLILSEGCDIDYFGDHFRLEQVIHNFLSNAVKYSPHGKKVLVDCRIEQDNIIVSIQDFGIGIASENLDKIFERYYRVDDTAIRFEGLGIGLFISSEILRRHHGSFWIESVEGEGSTFYFSLPL